MSYTENKKIQLENVNTLDEVQMMEEVQTFRFFSEALRTYLKENGYEAGKLDDKNLDKWIRARCREQGVTPPRSIMEDQTGVPRETQLKLCLALGLNRVQADDFLRRVCLAAPLYERNLADLIYGFLLEHPLGAQRQQALVRQYLSRSALKAGRMEEGPARMNTWQLKQEAAMAETEEELRILIEQNRSEFVRQRRRTAGMLKGLWEKAVAKADDETADGNNYYHFRSLPSKMTGADRAHQVLCQILGLIDLEDPLKKRSMKPLLDQPYIHEYVKNNFADRNKINKLFLDEQLSDDSMRKLMILLFFYLFWKEVERSDTRESMNQNERFFYELNQHLLEAGFHRLYPGDPYDWLFQAFCYGNNPLGELREFFCNLVKDADEKPEEE